MILVAIECGNLMPLNLTAIPQKYEKHGLCLQVLFVGQQRSTPPFIMSLLIYIMVTNPQNLLQIYSLIT